MKATEDMIKVFDRAVKVLFPESEIEHKTMTETWDSATVILGNGNYGKFNISPVSVRYNGRCCTAEENAKFESLTLNDELYNGKLFEIN